MDFTVLKKNLFIFLCDTYWMLLWSLVCTVYVDIFPISSDYNFIPTLAFLNLVDLNECI